MASKRDTTAGGSASTGRARTAATGQYVAKTSKQSAVSRSRGAHVSAQAGRFFTGSKVKVPLGARSHEAIVLEERNGRVRVEVHIAGAEPITTSYLAAEVQDR